MPPLSWNMGAKEGIQPTISASLQPQGRPSGSNNTEDSSLAMAPGAPAGLSYSSELGKEGPIEPKFMILGVKERIQPFSSQG